MTESHHLVKRSIEIAGHATSITLEPEFWAALKEIAAARNTSLPALVATLDASRDIAPEGRNLSSHLRVFVLKTLQQKPLA